MNYFYFIYIFLSICSKVYSESIEINSNGDTISPPAPVPVNYKKTITIENKYDSIIHLYWTKSKSDSISQGALISQIQPNSMSDINTFVGHSFFGTYTNGIEVQPILRAFPEFIDVTANTNHYVFEPLNRKQKNNLININLPPKLLSNNNKITNHSAVKILGVVSTALSAKFRCYIVTGCDYYYEDNRGGSFQGTLKLGKETTTNTYIGHVFFFTDMGTKNEIERFTMIKEKMLYVVIDNNRLPSKEMLAQYDREIKFSEDYLKKNGILWRHFFGPEGPRPPPVLYHHTAPEVGYKHKLHSKEGKWFCDGESLDCQSTDHVNLEMEVISLEPRAFIIPNFISDYEAEVIIKEAKLKLKVSTVGNTDGGGTRTSETRTSRNAWVGRKTNPTIESIYLRAADILNIDEELLQTNTNAEDMQVVYYVNGQKYDSHHDWGVSGYPESRFITLLMYLTDQVDEDAGGETSFPKAANLQGMKVHPGKGSAVLFYNLLEDGNGDDLALHAALPVHRGEKWLANFWVWDSKRR